MRKKIEFKKNVAQAVMGDINEAPRLHNIVTLNMGKEAPEVKPITDFQRDSISTRVKQLASITGDHALDVYRIILTDFGIEKIRLLPRDRYKEVVAILDKWIHDAKDSLQTTQEKKAIEKSQAAASQPAACLGCIEKSENYARLQLTARMRMAGLIACIGLCGWLLYKMPPGSLAAVVSHVDNRCYHDDKSYSVGSIIKNFNDTLMECKAATTDAPAMWLGVRRSH